MVDWYLGTMGFSWKEWKGVFYPESMNPTDFLSYYSRIFNAVEIDSTFYGIPKPEIVERWAASTPEGFSISAKMPKTITHDMGLKGTEPVLESFLDTIRHLGTRLGVILIQFPPDFTAAQHPALAEFLEKLPQDIRFAVEFRHRSWYIEKTEQLLSENHIAWAATEYRRLPMRIYRTTDFLYVRLIGWHGRYKEHTKEQADMTGSLEWWRDHIQEHLEHVSSVYGFFNNDYAGFAAGTTNRFRGIVGLEIKDFTPPKQEKFL